MCRDSKQCNIAFRHPSPPPHYQNARIHMVLSLVFGGGGAGLWIASFVVGSCVLIVVCCLLFVVPLFAWLLFDCLFGCFIVSCSIVSLILLLFCSLLINVFESLFVLLFCV